MIHGNRKSRILSGISANVFGQAITVGVQLAGVPLLLHYWGVQYYGEWLLLFTLPSYLGMSDFGLGTVATTEISMCVARQDFEKAGRVFRGAFFCVNAIGLAICSTFALSAWIFPYHNWLNLKQITPHELSIALTLLSGYIFCALFLTLLQGTYRVVGRYARGQIISNLFRLLEFTAMLIAAASGGGVVLAATAFFSIRLIYSGFVWFDIRRRAGWLRLDTWGWEWPSVRPLLPSSLSMMAVYMGQSLVSQGLVTIIGVSLGAASVVLFSTIRTLCNFAKQLIGIVNLSVFSEYAISIGKQDFAAARRLHTRSVQASVGLTLLSVAGLKIAGPWVLMLWTQGKVAAEEPFFSLYLCYILANSLWLGSWNMLLGCNLHQSITRFYLLASLLVIISTYIGVGRLGLSFVPVALLLSDALFSLVVLRKSLDVLRQPMPDFLRQALRWPVLKRP